MQVRKHLSFRAQPLLLAAGATIGLVAFEFIFLSQGYEKAILSEHYRYGVYYRLLAVVLLTICSLALIFLFFWASFASPYKYRIGYFCLFIFATAVEYGYQRAFGRFTRQEDAINAFVGADWRIRFEAVGMYFSPQALVPCLAFGALLLLAEPTLKRGLKPTAAVLAATCLFFSFTAYATRNTFLTVSVAAFWRTSAEFPINWHFGSFYQPPRRVLYESTREQIAYRTLQAPSNNIVFIVDESIRADHLSLNGYGRDTTPFLDELNSRGMVKNWGVAVSGATCSVSANNLLLTGLNELPDREFRVYRLPTIFQFARAAGYRTFYFDGQVSSFWNGKPSDAADLDEWITASDLSLENAYDADEHIARRVRELTEKSSGNFVWISKSGTHMPYRSSYPPTAARWTPVSDDAGSRGRYDPQATERSLIVNDYDNAVRFNSESFFRALLESGVPKNTVFLYTSDHGQTLGENGSRVSHCSNSKPEAAVPLFIIADSASAPPVDADYKASHANIFPTLLDLMGFPKSERRASYALSLFEARAKDSQPRFYFVGDLHGGAGSGKYAFD